MKTAIALGLGAAIITLTACKGRDDEGIGSSNIKAEAQLRSRVEAWYNKDDRAGVNGGQCAASCHTTIPFMLMNPMESIEDRVTADGFRQIVATRVSDWDNLLPLYSWAPEDSRSTEALLNVVSMLEYDRKVNKELSDTSCNALEQLWALQQDDGGFLWLDAGLSPWEDEYAPFFASSMLAISLARMGKMLDTTPTKSTCSQWQSQTENIDALHVYLGSNKDSTNKHGELWFYWANQEMGFKIFNFRDHFGFAAQLLTGLQNADGGFDLKDFGPFAKNADSPVMSQPYITGLVINALSGFELAETDSTYHVLSKAKAFMNNYSYSDIDTLRSLNRPSSDWNNGLFQDANLAFYLGATLTEQETTKTLKPNTDESL